MDAFLHKVERSAFRIALMATGRREDALDVVQEAMFNFVRSYRHKPESEWKPLFYKVLYRQIATFKRREGVRNRWFAWLPGYREDQRGSADVPDQNSRQPEHEFKVSKAYAALEEALRTLPPRQQQVVMLRGWQQLGVTETARVMGCSEGTVKAHYSRALSSLRLQLGEHWP